MKNIEEELYTSTKKDIAALCEAYNFNEILFTMIGLTLISIDDEGKRPKKKYGKSSKYKSKVAKKLDHTDHRSLKSLSSSENNHLAIPFEQSSTKIPGPKTLSSTKISLLHLGWLILILLMNSKGNYLLKEGEFALRFNYPIKLEANWPAVKCYYDSNEKHPIPTLQKVIETLFDDSLRT